LIGVGVPVAAGAAVIANLRDREPDTAPAGPTGPTGQPGALDFMADDADLVADFAFTADALRQDFNTRLDVVTDSIADSLETGLTAVTETQEATAEQLREERAQALAELEAEQARIRELDRLRSQRPDLVEQIAELESQAYRWALAATAGDGSIDAVPARVLENIRQVQAEAERLKKDLADLDSRIAELSAA